MLPRSSPDPLGRRACHPGLRCGARSRGAADCSRRWAGGVRGPTGSPRRPAQTTAVIAAAGSFASVSTLLGSPLLGAFLLMEASGLGGAVLGVVLVPGLLAAGIGSLIFIGGLTDRSGDVLSDAAWAAGVRSANRGRVRLGPRDRGRGRVRRERDPAVRPAATTAPRAPTRAADPGRRAGGGGLRSAVLGRDRQKLVRRAVLWAESDWPPC